MALPHGGEGLATRRVVGENFARREVLGAVPAELKKIRTPVAQDRLIFR
jgi:hypothetical protein